MDEGPLIKIQSIRFVTLHFLDYSFAPPVISSRVERWWRFLAQPINMIPAGWIMMCLLRQFYLSRGYAADIDVVRAQGGLLSDRSGFAVTFSLKEGPRYRLKDISFYLGD